MPFTKKIRFDSLAQKGAALIEDGMTIFTYCYSQTVLAIFKKAKRQGKHFTVICSETRPNFTGRMMAQALVELKIKVVLTLDSTALPNFLNSNLFLFGADLITQEGEIINKNGTALMIFLAKQTGVPSYVCTHSQKFGTDQEARKLLTKKRANKEFWKDPVQGVHFEIPAYDSCSLKDVTGILTEKGIRTSID